MPNPSANAVVGPVVLRRRIGREVQQLREAARLSVEQTVTETGWSRNKIWRIEAGKTPVTPTDVKYLCDLFEASPKLTDALIALARESRAKNWWHVYGDAIPDWFELYAGLEVEATRIANYESELVPGLLQTEGYMRLIFRAATGREDEETARQMEMRRKRQALLTRKRPLAPAFDFVVSEAVIRCQVGGVQVMAEQYRRLLYASQLPNVSLRVVPFRHGQHAAMMGPFALLNFDDPKDPNLAYVETQTGALYLERPSQVERYRYVFNDVQRRSLEPDRTQEFIREALRELA